MLKKVKIPNKSQLSHKWELVRLGHPQGFSQTEYKTLRDYFDSNSMVDYEIIQSHISEKSLDNGDTLIQVSPEGMTLLHGDNQPVKFVVTTNITSTSASLAESIQSILNQAFREQGLDAHVGVSVLIENNENDDGLTYSTSRS